MGRKNELQRGKRQQITIRNGSELVPAGFGGIRLLLWNVSPTEPADDAADRRPAYTEVPSEGRFGCPRGVSSADRSYHVIGRLGSSLTLAPHDTVTEHADGVDCIFALGNQLKVVDVVVRLDTILVIHLIAVRDRPSEGNPNCTMDLPRFYDAWAGPYGEVDKQVPGLVGLWLQDSPDVRVSTTARPANPPAIGGLIRRARDRRPSFRRENSARVAFHGAF